MDYERFVRELKPYFHSPKRMVNGDIVVLPVIREMCELFYACGGGNAEYVLLANAINAWVETLSLPIWSLVAKEFGR